MVCVFYEVACAKQAFPWSFLHEKPISVCLDASAKWGKNGGGSGEEGVERLARKLHDFPKRPFDLSFLSSPLPPRSSFFHSPHLSRVHKSGNRLFYDTEKSTETLASRAIEEV